MYWFVLPDRSWLNKKPMADQAFCVDISIIHLTVSTSSSLSFCSLHWQIKCRVGDGWIVGANRSKSNACNTHCNNNRGQGASQSYSISANIGLTNTCSYKQTWYARLRGVAGVWLHGLTAWSDTISCIKHGSHKGLHIRYIQAYWSPLD